MHTHETIAVPVNRSLTEIPANIGEWTMIGQSRFAPDILDNLRPTDYLYRSYEDKDGIRVTIYIGYHAGGPSSGPIHSPKNCLPGSGWLKLSEERRLLHVTDRDLPVVQASYQFHGQKEMFLYFFLVKGRVLTDEYSLKLAEIANSIFYNRRDSAFIRISVPFMNEELKAEKAGERFLTAIYPSLAATLPL
jgi:EpsI family protein